MVTFNRRTKIFVCKEPTDMRASYDTLFSKASEVLKQDPFSGHLFDPVPVERLELQSKEDLIEFIKLQQKVNDSIIKENQRLRALSDELREQALLIEDQYVTFKNKFFGKSSEREPVEEKDEPKRAAATSKKVKVQLPSVRYPDAALIERDVELQQLPSCDCCGGQMRDSGMTEDSEYLTVIPRQYLIIRQKRHKYCCGKCHGSLKTAAEPDWCDT